MLSVLVCLLLLLRPLALCGGPAGGGGPAGSSGDAAVVGLLERAVQLHAKGLGSAEEAAGLYESVLSLVPSHVTALHNLAALHYTMGQHQTVSERESEGGGGLRRCC